MEKECIILSGGLGTRLKSVVPDLPKSMAYIDGKPFLWYLVRYFLSQEVTTFVFALGYKQEVIEAYLSSSDSPFSNTDAQYKISVENEPLGTGGAIKKALMLTKCPNVLIANGDTMFQVDTTALLDFHNQQQSLCTLALKPMVDFERYGFVEIDGKNKVTDFKEKQFYEKGNINGGIYALDVDRFMQMDFPEKFSFEKEFLEPQAAQGSLFGLLQNGYFIDIGIPEDYERAQTELPALFSK
ncbi:MAG: nucleotidyltransferase [Pseudopedobacter saltans]|uniref:Nucleotidyltransferase n=1 Tax=Pseudopedobacter saltans TaxID=151895 RepID=A0A2W5F5N7_9SPHI|nr:MAG: nucleotidyltransferase [Pseudopedobacter saltans]